jgi:hypothetical protein
LALDFLKISAIYSALVFMGDIGKGWVVTLLDAAMSSYSLYQSYRKLPYYKFFWMKLDFTLSGV